MIQDASPLIYRFYDGIGIQWYGVSYLLSVLFIFTFLSWLVYRHRFELPQSKVGDFLIYSIIGMVLGARIGYCLFYEPLMFLQFKSEFPFWGVFALGEGGLSVHGGIVGLILALILFSIRSGASQLYLFDLASVSAGIVFFFHRVASFFHSENLGTPVAENFPYAVRFPQEIYFWQVSAPEKWQQLIHSALSSYFNLDKSESITQSLQTILDSFQNGQVAVREVLIPLLTPRHPVQIYSAILEGFFLFLFLFLVWFKSQKPGVIFSLFLILFSSFRVVLNHFTMENTNLGGFGQVINHWEILNILTFLIGCWCLLFYSRRTTLKQPGWGLGQNVKLHRK